MSGCAICVYDLYSESIEAYDRAIETLRTSLQAAQIPEGEWPDQIMNKNEGGEGGKERRKDIVLSVFEELELALAAKQEKLQRAKEKEDFRQDQEDRLPSPSSSLSTS